jgi:hypothetical protein
MPSRKFIVPLSQSLSADYNTTSLRPIATLQSSLTAAKSTITLHNTINRQIMDDPFPNFDSLHRLMEVQRPTRHANFLDLVNQKLLEPPKRKSVLAPYFAAVLEFQKPYHTPSPSPSPSPEPLSRPVSANPKPRQAKRTSDEAFMPASNGSGPGRKKARISGRREIRNSRREFARCQNWT